MDKQTLAQRIKLRSPNKDPSTKAFQLLGARVASLVSNEIAAAFGDQHQIRVLEFGAGSGRVALPLAQLLPYAELEAVDVDEEAVAYMKLVAPRNLRASMNAYYPPLQFADRSIDCIYAISIWTHFPLQIAEQWLAELHRIIKPGGLLIISVAGEASLAAMRASRKLLCDVTIEQLKRDKFVCREMVNLRDPGLYPGVSGGWGDVLIHPDFIHENWKHLFETIVIRVEHLPGKQDLIVMRRPEIR